MITKKIKPYYEKCQVCGKIFASRTRKRRNESKLCAYHSNNGVLTSHHFKGGKKVYEKIEGKSYVIIVREKAQICSLKTRGRDESM